MGFFDIVSIIAVNTGSIRTAVIVHTAVVVRSQRADTCRVAGTWAERRSSTGQLDL